jgi:hypothetical protein
LGYLQRLGRWRVGPGRSLLDFIHFEQNANASLLRRLPAPGSFEQMRALIFGKLDVVLFVRHGNRKWTLERALPFKVLIQFKVLI